MKKGFRISISIIISAITLFFGFSVGLAQSGDIQNNPIRFAIIGDRTAGHIPGIYGQIAIEIERMKPDFVMTVGDMIEEEADDTALIIRNWIEYDSLVDPISSEIYYTPGNNDIWSDLSEEMYRRFAGEPYYSFDYEYLDFIILDNSRIATGADMPEDQIAWLIDDLKENSDAGYTLVFFHRPFWAEEIAMGKPDRLHEIFKQYGVDAVFSGHYHEYFSGEFDGIMYTNLGSSGGATHACASEMEFHFAWVTVDRGGIYITPIQMGAVMAWDETTIDDKNAYDPIRNMGMAFEKPLFMEDDLTVKEADISLTLNNAYSRYPLDDTLRWSVPEGWTVEPLILPVSIPAGQAGTYQFHVNCPGSVRPLPSVETVFDYSEEKSLAVRRDLWIARKAFCYPVSESPHIDGSIDEDFWQNPTELLYHPEGGEMDIDPMKFYYAYDSDNLYIAAYCVDNQENSPIARAEEHDGAVYAEDCVGFFFEPRAGSDTVYQIYINPLGTIFDARITRSEDGWMNNDRGWNGDYEVKAVMRADFWSVEARIPVDQFGLKIKKDNNWYLNFRRKQKALESAADWQTPIGSDPKTMGVLIIK
jgi:predicted phosphodiesterase